MRLYLEGSIECDASTETAKTIKSILEDGKFGHRTEYKKDGEIFFEFRKELLTIEDHELVEILKAYSKANESDVLNFLKRW